MHFISDAIQNGDYCALFFFSMIVMVVGDRMVSSQPQMRIWGLRIAALAFVGFTVNHIVEVGSPLPPDLAMAALVGLLGGIVTLGPAWIALAISAVLVRYGRKVASSADSAALRLHREREKLQEERRRKREQLEWQRTAPERERAAKLEAERRERESARQHEAQQQRADARADCEMLYQLYAVDISERFPRQALDEWIAKYMGDDQSAGNVHRRAEQLRKIIIHHREQVKPTPKFSDLTQLANWTSQQEEEIKSLPIDGRLQRMLLANLKVKNAELATQILENSG